MILYYRTENTCGIVHKHHFVLIFAFASSIWCIFLNSLFNIYSPYFPAKALFEFSFILFFICVNIICSEAFILSCND